MGLLSTLLHEASARRPAEVVIETDRPVRMRLADGTSAELAAAIEGTAISDELSDLLTTEQQVDLALGETVKFELVVGLYTWHLVGETAQEVVLVRACPTGELLESTDSVQIPIEPDEIEVDTRDIRDTRDTRDTRDIPRMRRTIASGPSEIDIDINFDDEAATSPGEVYEHEPFAGDERPSKGLRLAALKPVPADTKPQPIWPRRVARAVGPERGARAATRAAGSAPRTAAAGPHVAVASRAGVAPRAAEPATWPRDARRARAGAQPVTGSQPVADIHAVPGRQLALRREDRKAMAELLAAFEPGSLALLLRAAGHAEALADALELPSMTLSDDDTQAQASARLGELGPDGVLIVRAEDPSPWLGWLLRRVEEGRRVIVETEAQTPAGARRVLLGVGATPRAELWLDAVRVLSATINEDGWALLSPGN